MRYRRKIKRKKFLRPKKVILVTLFLSTVCISIGYAAFNTNINLSAKGNIYKTSDKCYETSDNGDGTVTITDYNKECGSEVNVPSTIRGKTVTKIGSTSWNIPKVFNSKGLTKVVIPDTVKYIGAYAFWDNSISSLDLGNGVEEIGDEAFVHNKLTNITFPNSLKKLKCQVFRYNNLTSIPPLENIEYEGGVFTGNNLTGDEAFVYGKNSNGIIDNTILNSYAGTWKSEITVPSSVKTIQSFAFRQIAASTVNFTNVETIGNIAFFQSYITTINISNTIKYIDNEAITQSADIKTINIDRKENAIEGAPWGAVNATVNWTGTN